MAATTINVRAVEDGIASAKKQLMEQQAALDEISRVINSMEGVWESESQRAYAEQFRVRKRRIETFNQSISRYLDSMRRYVNDCSSLDGRASSRLRNVSW